MRPSDLTDIASLALVGGALYLLARGIKVSAFGSDIITIGGPSDSSPSSSTPGTSSSLPPSSYPATPSPAGGFSWWDVPFLNPFWGIEKAAEVWQVFT